MTEQEQAQQLARWLEQPAGTPPPEGLDPEVIESVYAMRPDLAPAPRLTADDILADLGDFDLAIAGIADGGAEDADLQTGAMPPTVVGTAPPAWRSANRVAGIAVLLATAATLLLVALPVANNEVAMEEGVAPAAREVAAPARSVPDPIASVEDEPGVQQAPAATPNEPAEAIPEILGGQLDSMTGDAVADAGVDVDNNADDFRQEQQMRLSSESSSPEIPELQDQWGEDAVADAEEAEGELAEAPALEYAAPTSAPPAAQSGGDYEYDAGYGSKGRAQKRESRKSAAADEPSAEPVAPSSRSAAWPSDVSDGAWRQYADAGTQQAIDAAVQNAAAEASLGNTSRAVQLLLVHVTSPAVPGQYVASVAVQYQMNAGDLRGAESTAQRGLGLSSTNNPYRALLLAQYGDVLDRLGDPAGAEAAWQQAAALNRSR